MSLISFILPHKISYLLLQQKVLLLLVLGVLSGAPAIPNIERNSDCGKCSESLHQHVVSHIEFEGYEILLSGQISKSMSLSASSRLWLKGLERGTIASFLLNTYSVPSGSYSTNPFSELQLQIQARLGGLAEAYLPEPLANLSMGMAFGTDLASVWTLHHLSKDIGMSHVVAASGFNVGVVIGLVQRKNRFLGYSGRLISSLVFIWLYVWVAGLSISLLRAATMSSLMILAKLTHRPLPPLTAFMLTVVGLLCINPHFSGEVSFQLSVAATLGMILVLPALNSGVFTGICLGLPEENNGNQERQQVTGLLANAWKSLKNMCVETLFSSVAAQAFVFPILLYHFSEFSLVSIVANVALLWMTPFMTVASLLWLVVMCFCFKLVPAWLLQLSSFVVVIPLHFFVSGVHAVSSLPRGLILVSSWGWPQVLIWWLFLWLVLHLRRKAIKRHQKEKNKCFFATRL